MTTDLKSTRILVPGRLPPHAMARLAELFTVTPVGPAGNGTLDVDPNGIRGIAVAGLVDAALIDALPDLEIIASFGVGYDAVDAKHAASRDVIVTNTPDVLTDEVADTAVALVLNTVRELPRAEQWLRDGRWSSEGPYRLTPTMRGRRVGIYGMGRIGQAIAKRLSAFDLPVSYHNRRPVEGVGYHYFETLVELAANVDLLISVVPSTPETERSVDAHILQALGPDGIFVNIGRGTTVDEEALTEALHAGTIAGAGLDVFMDEPNVPQRLLDAPNACLLPHVGSATVHTRRAMADLVVDNLKTWFETGKPLTPVRESLDVVRSQAAAGGR